MKLTGHKQTRSHQSLNLKYDYGVSNFVQLPHKTYMPILVDLLTCFSLDLPKYFYTFQPMPFVIIHKMKQELYTF